MKLTGINNFGNTLIFAIAFSNIKCKETYQWILKTFSDRCKAEYCGKPKLLIVPHEQEIFDGCEKIYPEVPVIVNQYHFLSVTKDMLNQYKKRMDFDHILCCTKLDQIVQEINRKKFDKLKDDIL